MAIKLPNNNKNLTNAIRLTFILGGLLYLYFDWCSLSFTDSQPKDVPISDVIKRANDGQISKITIQGDDITVTPKVVINLPKNQLSRVTAVFKTRV